MVFKSMQYSQFSSLLFPLNNIFHKIFINSAFNFIYYLINVILNLAAKIPEKQQFIQQRV